MSKKPLMLTLEDTKNCVIRYSVNRFEVYHRDGWLIFAAGTKQMLINMISMHRIENPKFVGLAASRYLEEL